MISVGLFGKLPAYGDFLQRDLPEDFVNNWDGWLQRVIVGSRAQLGEQWLPAYLSGPIWRFALSDDLAGGCTWCGILMPSVDRVGRYFPLAIAGRWERGTSLFHLAVAAEPWLRELESIALDALEASYLDVNDVMTRIRALPVPVAVPRSMADASGWQGPFPCVPDLASAWLDRLETQATAELAPYSLWWTAGSEVAAAQWKAVRAWPDAAGFVQMLGPGDGAPSMPEPATATQSVAVAPLLQSPLSAGVTGAGHVRSTNQDAWIDRGDAGCWVVADGMGGHADGERASRAVVDAVSAQLRAAASLASTSLMVRAGIEAANDTLRQGVAEDDDQAAGSTVVALAICGNEAAALWMGDSRLYLWRAGSVVQVTDDHVSGDHAHEITRAVGGTASAEVDEKRFTVHAGDRLLLCSDGVHGVLPGEALITLMAAAMDPLSLVQSIEKAVLAGRAPDNYTAVSVFV
jgi:type VI secretion system protein ImpM